MNRPLYLNIGECPGCQRKYRKEKATGISITTTLTMLNRGWKEVPVHETRVGICPRCAKRLEYGGVRAERVINNVMKVVELTSLETRKSA